MCDQTDHEDTEREIHALTDLVVAKLTLLHPKSTVRIFSSHSLGYILFFFFFLLLLVVTCNSGTLAPTELCGDQTNERIVTQSQCLFCVADVS